MTAESPPGALRELLLAIEQEREPEHSTRVAKALRRVAVRELDEKVTSGLKNAGGSLLNARGGHLKESRDLTRLHALSTLAASLNFLRPDPRSACLCACVDLALDRPHAVLAQLLPYQRWDASRDGVSSWIALNSAAAAERVGDMTLSIALYRSCAAENERAPSFAAAAFGLLGAVRMGLKGATGAFAGSVLEGLQQESNPVREQVLTYLCRRAHADGDGRVAEARTQLRRLGAMGEFLDLELFLTS
jgi:hypothetical protein